MQLVIDLPNRYYEMVKDFDTVNIGRCRYKGVQYQVINAIKKGIPLPEGHGRLIDADKYRHLWVDTYDSSYGDECAKLFKGSIDNADTVIEADGGTE